jgi:hypothetical protein
MAKPARELWLTEKRKYIDVYFIKIWFNPKEMCGKIDGKHFVQIQSGTLAVKKGPKRKYFSIVGQSTHSRNEPNYIGITSINAINVTKRRNHELFLMIHGIAEKNKIEQIFSKIEKLIIKWQRKKYGFTPCILDYPLDSPIYLINKNIQS